MKKINQTSGFTIVELLIVIVVIAILAAITIVAYNGIRARTIDASMQTDLRNSSSKLEIVKTTTGSYPVDTTSAALRPSGNNVLSYESKPYGYCISATNTGAQQSLTIKSSSGKIENGNCTDATVTHFAGTTGGGLQNGPSATAQFAYPHDIAVDTLGNMFIADRNNDAIRKIAPDGTVSTFAGAGVGYNATTASALTLNDPTGVAIDGANNLYVANAGSSTIMKITPSANATHIGSGLDIPTGIALDSQGNIFIADSGSNRIYRVTPAGVTTIFAGSGAFNTTDGTGTGAAFGYPESLDIDSANNIYVADSANNRIRKITPAAVVTTIAGSTDGYADGTGASARFSYPEAIKVDDNGNMYVADAGNNRIRKVTPAGVVTTLAGSTDGYALGVGTAAQFSYPEGLGFDNQGYLYVGDGSARILRLSL